MTDQVRAEYARLRSWYRGMSASQALAMARQTVANRLAYEASGRVRTTYGRKVMHADGRTYHYEWSATPCD